ncbi:DNA-3-methyladenine glycosylase family protein [Desulfotomaculum sp. 1211_IL3151]|uniref:DNA-3-methyladenine glycosylase family protein n=1 Tax=Desulfotomaculum sp. 1211_IL3151 TaxID=3084055 RepID=UPI002FDA7464
MSDEDVCKRLSQIKGVGVWTAEMLMIFSMQRMNVISWGDMAIIRGLRMLYHHREITPKLFAKYKKRYSPYATVASLYLWQISHGACEGLGKQEPLRLFEQPGYAVAKQESTAIEVSLKAWLALTNTPEHTGKEIIALLEDDMRGGTSTGFAPYLKDGEIYFEQRCLPMIGIKQNTNV